MKSIIITPTGDFIKKPEGYKTVFLAGTISESKEDWQKSIIEAVMDFKKIIFNPRRENWNSDWEQSMNNPKFVEQVNWELEKLELADMIIMNLTPGTMSPISLLEFGMYSKSGKLIVYCPEGFWRKGNIDVTCDRYNIPQVQKFEELITLIKYL